MGFENFQEWTLHNLCVQPVPLWKCFVFLLSDTSCISGCGLCVLCYHSGLLLGRVWLFLFPPSLFLLYYRILYYLLIYYQDSPQAFSFLSWWVTALTASPHMSHFQRSQTFSWFFLNSLQFVHICCTGKPRNEHRTADMSYQCWAGGRDNLPQPAGNTVCHSALKAVNILCCEGWLVAYIFWCSWRLPGPSLHSCCPAASWHHLAVVLQVISHQE